MSVSHHRGVSMAAALLAALKPGASSPKQDRVPILSIPAMLL